MNLAGGSRFSYKWLILPIVAILGFLSYQYFLSGSGVIEGYSVGNNFELSVAPNYSIKCTIEDTMQIKYDSGRTVNGMTARETFNPLIRYDVVDRNSRELFNSFPSDIYLTCDVPNVPVLLSGSFYVYATAADPTGRDVKIYEKTISVPEITITDNIRMKLPSYLIYQKDIDSQMPAGSGNYLSWIRIHTAPHLLFTIPSASSQSQYSGSDLQTSYSVRIIKDVPITSAAKGTQVSITSFSPKTFKLPLLNTQTFLTVNGQMDYYTSGEGMPWITITDPSGLVSQKTRFTKVTNTDNDKWSEFSLTIQIPSSPKTGTYKIQMGSDQPLRTGKPTVTFEVVKADTPTTESTTGGSGTSSKCGGTGQVDCCSVGAGGGDGTNSCLPLKSYVAYTINLEGGAVTGTVPNVQLFDLKIIPKATITGDLKGTQTRLAEIKLIPQIDFSGVTQKFTISGANFVHTYSLLVNGVEKVRDAQFDGRQISTANVLAANNQYQLSLISVNPSEFIKKLQSNDPTFRFADGDTLTFTMKVTGSMNVQIGLDKYSAVIDGLTYSYDMVNSETVNNPEPCQGQQPIVDCIPPPVDNPAECKSPYIPKLNDQGKYDCIDPNASGGSCAGLTSAECDAQGKLKEKDEQINILQGIIDAIKGGNNQTQGNPKGQSGVTGLCGVDKTTEECIAYWKSLIGVGSSFVVNTTLVVAIIIITVMLIVIGLIIKSRRR